MKRSIYILVQALGSFVNRINRSRKFKKRIKILFLSTLLILGTLFGISNLFQTSSQSIKTYGEGFRFRETASRKYLERVSEKGPKIQKVLVVIDPGHGGNDPGTSHGQLIEKDLNLDISLRIQKLLEEKNVQVLMTRETDVFVGLVERAIMANEANADLFISVHNNSMPGSSSFRGTETLYTYSANAGDAFNGKDLAKIIQSELVKALGTIDIGTLHRPNLAVLRHTKMPAVIAEIAYISNAQDRERLQNPSFRQRAAEAIVTGVIKALEEIGAYISEDGEWVIKK